MFLHLSVILFTRRSLSRGLCLGVGFSDQGGSLLGGLFPRSLFPGGSLSRVSVHGGGGRSLSMGVSVQGSLCLCLAGLCPSGSLSKRSLSRGISVQDGLCPGVSFKGCLCPEGSVQGMSLSRGFLSKSLCPGRGVSVHGVLYPGDSLLGRHPLYGNERAVRILLEWILVLTIKSFWVSSDVLSLLYSQWIFQYIRYKSQNQCFLFR